MKALSILHYRARDFLLPAFPAVILIAFHWAGTIAIRSGGDINKIPSTIMFNSNPALIWLHSTTVLEIRKFFSLPFTVLLWLTRIPIICTFITWISKSISSIFCIICSMRAGPSNKVLPCQILPQICNHSSKTCCNLLQSYLRYCCAGSEKVLRSTMRCFQSKIIWTLHEKARTMVLFGSTTAHMDINPPNSTLVASLTNSSNQFCYLSWYLSKSIPHDNNQPRFRNDSQISSITARNGNKILFQSKIIITGSSLKTFFLKSAQVPTA